MKNILVTVIVSEGNSYFNIAVSESKPFKTEFAVFVPTFFKWADFLNNDNAEVAEKKIDYTINTCQKYLDSNSNFDKLDDLLLLFLQAIVTGKITCFKCKKTINPSDLTCKCGWNNLLIEKKFI